MRFELFGVSYCFVNSHLSAHDHLLSQRILEYNTIIDTHKYKSRDSSNILYHEYVEISGNFLRRFDFIMILLHSSYIVWMGDLNFRLIEGSLTFDQVLDKVRKENLKEMLEVDQLRDCIKKQLAFHELKDITPTFPPTYKFVIDTDDYDQK